VVVVNSIRMLPRDEARKCGKRNFTMILPTPEYLSNLNQVVLKLSEIILFVLFVILLIVKGIQGIVRQCRKGWTDAV
jgi:hypothetical protein